MKKVFWENPYQQSLETKVTPVEGNELLFEGTIAYSFAGGQESDKAYINSLEPMSNGEIKAHTNVIPKIRAAEKQEMEWINNCYDQVEFIHSHFENEVIAIAEFRKGVASALPQI